MGDKQTISAQVTGGEASAGPPLGPALGPLGVNIMEVINKINEKKQGGYCQCLGHKGQRLFLQ